MRNLLVFVVALLVGGGLVFVLQSERRGAAQQPDESALEPDRAPAPSKAEPAGTLPMTGDQRESEASGTHPAPGPSSISGTLVVLDENGGEHPAEDGFLALGLGVAGARTQRECRVEDGRWSLSLDPARDGGATLVLRSCVLARRNAVPAPGKPAELTIPADGRIELRLHWPAAPRLHVVAHDSGRELEQVFLYELPLEQRGSPLDRQHPGPDAKPRAAGPSPVRLGDDGKASLSPTRVLFAKSPGYAWARIELDPSSAEDSTLRLEPAGALELSVVGEPENTELEILLLEAAPPHAEVLVRRRGEARTFVLEDLRPGRYTAEARHSGLLAGTLALEVVAGGRAQAVLEVTRSSAADVPLAGVLVVPAEYEVDDFLLEFLLQGRFDGGSLSRGSFEIRRSEMTLAPGSKQQFSWSVPAVRPARYRIHLAFSAFVTEVDTGPAGTRTARIEVPPPGLVTLRCVDEETGAEVSSEKPTFVVLGPRVSSKRGKGGGASPFQFVAPQGQVLILTTPVLYESSVRLVEVGPGTNEILLPLRRKP